MWVGGELSLFKFSVSNIHSFIHSFILSFIHSSMALQPFFGLWPLLQFRNLCYKGGRTPWTGDQPVARPLPTHRTTQTQNTCTQTSMPWVGFEPTIPSFERAKTVHALDGAATVIGLSDIQLIEFRKGARYKHVWPKPNQNLESPNRLNVLVSRLLPVIPWSTRWTIFNLWNKQKPSTLKQYITSKSYPLSRLSPRELRLFSATLRFLSPDHSQKHCVASFKFELNAE
jgi:hypothetical protein